MLRSWAGRIGLVAVFSVGVGASCSKNGRGSTDPNACMRRCDQDECDFHASSVGDNQKYLDCLEGCQKKCGGG
ncbi:MAG: hypothetical protein ACRBN8_27865 [Nannocystales bacterium]